MSLIEAKFQCLACSRYFVRCSSVELQGGIPAATRAVLTSPSCYSCHAEGRLIACRHIKTLQTQGTPAHV